VWEDFVTSVVRARGRRGGREDVERVELVWAGGNENIRRRRLGGEVGGLPLRED
jgi:hypothetical protein